jgi:hypothetical protein
MYGMAQAGRRWQRSIFTWFVSQGFKASHNDPCLFQRRDVRQTPDGPREELVIIGVYVEDLFVLYSHDDAHSLYRSFTNAMQARWEVDDEGEVNDLLNVEISHEDGFVVLRQTSYYCSTSTSSSPSSRSRSPSPRCSATRHRRTRTCPRWWPTRSRNRTRRRRRS